MRVVLFAVFVIASFLFLREPSFSSTSCVMQVETTPVSGAAVYVRHGQSKKYERIKSKTTPASLDLPCGAKVDIRVHKSAGPFLVWEGAQSAVSAPKGGKARISIPMWSRFEWGSAILVVAILGFAALGVFIGKLAKEAQEARQEAKAVRMSVDELLTEAFAIANVPIPSDKRIERYQILRLIGKGGMAAVYKVMDDKGGIFALKIPSVEGLQDQDFVTRFKRETELGQRLSCPNIVRIVGGGEYRAIGIEKVPYLVMEYVDGDPLDKQLPRGRILPIKESFRIIQAIAGALQYAHGKGVIHRDIKPQNVMINRKREIKVMDFGIAKSSALSSLTVTGTALGTPIYMSPEQLNSKTVDVRTDLYALGIVFFQLLTGRVPFEGEDSLKVTPAHLTQPTPRPSSLAPTIPRNVDDLVLKLLEKDPNQRFQSAVEFVDSLYRVQQTLN
ncbi:MAG: serine/threonine protein kinase [Armatimonadetes bacterium]|nr:serine/threonine protein kinase [Armatimonadota bacterium]